MAEKKSVHLTNKGRTNCRIRVLRLSRRGLTLKNSSPSGLLEAVQGVFSCPFGGYGDRSLDDRDKFREP